MLTVVKYFIFSKIMFRPPYFVMPAQAGIQLINKKLSPRHCVAVGE